MKRSSKNLNIQSISKFYDALKTHSPSNQFEFLFITAAGIIIAEMEEPLDGKPTLEDYVEDMTNNRFNINVVDYLKHEEIDRLKSKDEVAGDTVNLIGDGSLILLKNVKFYHQPDQEPYLTISSFALHAADVIGFSLIPKDN